jgi:outer membrane receptor protein involved in Fe transport
MLYSSSFFPQRLKAVSRISFRIFPSVFYLTFLGLMLVAQTAWAQFPPGGGGQRPPAGGMQRQNINGRFYGKVIDAQTGKPIGYATVQLFSMQMDTATRTQKEALITGQLTKENGDFSLENVPMRRSYTLKVGFMGYETYEQQVAFDMGKGISGLDKDLGNIRLTPGNELLKEVTITGEAPTFTMAIDKKIYNVDKDGIAAGGTAEDALRNVPSLNVDIDGNLTLRNAAPQIFVDGRPTTLTLDQIPADAIASVEVITNPSAKYDASGGNGGIVNIVMRKNRRIGYNGTVRAGVDMRGRFNLGGDLNAREGKFNAFVGGNYRGRKSLSWGETDRENFFGNPLTNVFQETEGVRDGYFNSLRGGIDWFIDNRNTLTFSGNTNGGRFRFNEDIRIRTDTLFQDETSSGPSLRTTENDRNWRNHGGQLLYKRLFPKQGKEWTADANINTTRGGNTGNFRTDYFGALPEGRQRQDSKTFNDFITLQTDVVEPLDENKKLEYGARAALRTFNSDNANFQYNPSTGNFDQIKGFADKYRFKDQVYAAYTTYTQSFQKWGYQTGLRAESSFYEGVLPDADTAFSINYPISLFPSIFLNYKLNEDDNLQLNYSRRINRPSFFQLIPFPDFSDSLQLSVGNPNLKPEFTNALEMSYQNILSKGNNFLASVYLQHVSNLMTRYQFTAFNEEVGRDVVVSTYVNANNSVAYGTEFTLKNTFLKSFELVSNLNMYNAVVDATNVEANLRNSQFTWFIKENLTARLPKSLTLQLSGSYQSRTAFALGGGSRGLGGGGGWHGGPSSTAQGYTLPVWFVDFSLRKDLFDRAATVTLSVSDIFRSRIRGSRSEGDFFVQEQWSRRDPQFVSLNFSWRFGKFDASLFKRKNTKFNSEGMDMGF